MKASSAGHRTVLPIAQPSEALSLPAFGSRPVGGSSSGGIVEPVRSGQLRYYEQRRFSMIRVGSGWMSGSGNR